MAKVLMNSALRQLRGQVDQWVFKRYCYGTVVTRRPDMSRVKPSAAQRAHREKVKEAGEFYKKVLQDPVLLKRYRAVAKKKKLPLPAVTLAEFFRTARETRRK
jgi:type I restriction-modification system DNA methylase subunit